MKLIVHLKEDYLLNRKRRRFQSKLMIQIYVFDDLIEFLNLKRMNLMKQWNSLIQILNSTETTFIQNNQIEKIYLFSIDFIHSQIVDFIIFITLKQKYDEIHWIDNFWIILVKKRIFCLFDCFLKWRKKKSSKIKNVFFIVKNGIYLFDCLFFSHQKTQQWKFLFLTKIIRK